MIKTTISGIYPKLIESKEVPHLKRNLHKFDKGDITRDELGTVFRKNTKQILKEQFDAGINIISEGLIRWEDFYSPFANAWGGVERGTLKRIFNTNTLQRKPVIKGAVEYKKSQVLADAKYAIKKIKSISSSQTIVDKVKDCLLDASGEKLDSFTNIINKTKSCFTNEQCSSTDFKAIIPGPISFGEDSDNKYYEGKTELFKSIAKALNQELLALEKEGVKYVEIYDPYLYFGKYNDELLEKVYKILLDGVSSIKVILGSFYGTPKKDNIRALKNVPLAGFSLDLVNNSESLDWLTDKTQDIVQLGIFDARTTAQDNIDKAKEQVKKAQELYPESEIWVSLNNSPEFLPRANAIEKMKNLKQIINL